MWPVVEVGDYTPLLSGAYVSKRFARREVLAQPPNTVPVQPTHSSAIGVLH